jgi:hypothetical protein
MADQRRGIALQEFTEVEAALADLVRLLGPLPATLSGPRCRLSAAGRYPGQRETAGARVRARRGAI